MVNTSSVWAGVNVNAIISIVEEDITENAAIFVCILACFSTQFECNITNTTAPTSSVGIISGSVTSYDYPTQALMFTELESDTTYEFCVVAINVTDMTEVGNLECRDFNTGGTIEGTVFSNTKQKLE